MLRNLAIGAGVCTLTFIVPVLSVSHAVLDTPVSVQFTYESDCPFCHIYFLAQMCKPFIQKGIQSNAIKLELLPYGNAQAWNECQHGPVECQHNMVEACILKHIPDPVAQLDVICCYEEQLVVGYPDPIGALKKCTSLPSFAGAQADVLKCYGNFAGKEGIAAVKNVAARTPKDHQYVPWVSVNGVHDPLAERNLHDRLCQLPPLNAAPECKSVNMSLANFPVASSACWKNTKAVNGEPPVAPPLREKKLAKDMEESPEAIVV